MPFVVQLYIFNDSLRLPRGRTLCPVDIKTPGTTATQEMSNNLFLSVRGASREKATRATNADREVKVTACLTTS